MADEFAVPEDALVAIALQPCARDTIRLAQMGQERGATVIGITDSRTTPLAARSDLVITVPCRSPQFFESYVSTTALLETIVNIKSGSRNVAMNALRKAAARSFGSPGGA